jgi:hypothetical protein
LAQIHAPRKAGCRLLTHRFKPTKINVDTNLGLAERVITIKPCRSAAFWGDYG